MGATVWLQVRDGPAADSRDNSMLLRLEAQLVALATQLGVRPLTTFYCYGSLAAEAADEFADELADAGIEPPLVASEEWFDSKEGLASLDAITGALRGQPEALGFRPRRGEEHWPAMLAEELQYCQGRLREAAAKGLEFRFQIVP